MQDDWTVGQDEVQEESLVVNERDATITLEVQFKPVTFSFSTVHQSEDNEALFEAVGAPLCEAARGGSHGCGTRPSGGGTP